MIRFSVIVLLYNTNMDKIYLTLKSVLKQNFEGFEIVIADDGSNIDHSEELKSFFHSLRFVRYKFTEKKKNVGTVLNILDGLQLCEGKYVKVIGAGDLLYNEWTLQRVYDFMESGHYPFCFGLLKGFHFDDQNQIHQHPFNAPKDIEIYRDTDRNYKKIKKNVIVFGDWISGASIFIEKDMLLQYLQRMNGIVKYCEDVLTANALLEQKQIGYLKQNVVWYEVGEGISTASLDSPYIRRIKADQQAYFQTLSREYPEARSVLKRGIRMMWFNNHRDKLLYRIMRNFIEPTRIFFVIRVNIQKRKSSHWNGEKGFLDNQEKLG